MDANSDTWSTCAQAGRPGYPIESDIQAAYGVNYQAQDFTWTHKCTRCTWYKLSDTCVYRCNRGNDYTRKYPTNVDTMFGRKVSKWYLVTPCNQWFYYCPVCQEFFESRFHCGVESPDVYAMKYARATRGRH